MKLGMNFVDFLSRKLAMDFVDFLKFDVMNQLYWLLVDFRCSVFLELIVFIPAVLISFIFGGLKY
jgi:hypothetical protein